MEDNVIAAVGKTFSRNKYLGEPFIRMPGVGSKNTRI